MRCLCPANPFNIFTSRRTSSIDIADVICQKPLISFISAQIKMLCNRDWRDGQGVRIVPTSSTLLNSKIEIKLLYNFNRESTEIETVQQPPDYNVSAQVSYIRNNHLMSGVLGVQKAMQQLYISFLHLDQVSTFMQAL